MRVTISNLCGCAQIKFYKGDQVVHVEAFNGKTTTPYTRNVGELPNFDRHELAALAHREGWPEFSYSVHA